MSSGDMTDLLGMETDEAILTARKLRSKEPVQSKYFLIFFLVGLLSAYAGGFLPFSQRIAEEAVSTFFEPRETRQIKQYWTSFFAASKAKSVSKKASLLAEKMYKENITASVESLLTKIERTPFWSGSYLASVGLDKDEAAVITEELKKRKAVKSSKQQEERKGQ